MPEPESRHEPVSARPGSPQPGLLAQRLMMTPAQCRAARALLDWSRRDLATAADVAERTVVDFERGARRPYNRTLKDLRAAFEAAGVRFIPENGGGPGVRLHAVDRPS